LYTVNNIIRALGIYFKAFHVFQLNYPYLAGEHLWILIQIAWLEKIMIFF